MAARHLEAEATPRTRRFQGSAAEVIGRDKNKVPSKSKSPENIASEE